MPLFCNIYIITSLFFVFENKRHYTEKHLIANLKVTKTECTKFTKLKVTKNIFNLQELAPKHAKLQIFIPANLYCL